MADLTTLANVKRYIFGNEDNLDADDLLASLIASSSEYVQRQIGRRYDTRTVTETRDGDGSRRMLLEQAPVTSVTSVTVNGAAIPARATVDGDGWVYDDGGVTLVGYVFDAGIQNVVFVYQAGATIPADLEQAVIRHVALEFYDRSHVGLASVSGDGSTTFSPAAALAYIDRILDLHRELVVT